MSLVLHPYTPGLHYDHLKRWALYRDLPESTVKDIPHLGFIVIKESNIGVAAGFLRRCEGDYAIIDGYMTNPTCSSQERNEALDMITQSIVNTTKTHGISKILAFTADAGIVERAKKHGFALLPHTFIVYPGAK